MLGTLLKFATPFVVHLLLFRDGGGAVVRLHLLLAAGGEVSPAVRGAADLLATSRVVSLLCDSALKRVYKEMIDNYAMQEGFL